MLRAGWRKSSEAGGCNFCARDVDVVLEISSSHPRRTMLVRTCPKCLDALQGLPDPQVQVDPPPDEPFCRDCADAVPHGTCPHTGRPC